jgi:hypothetical protein
MRFIKWYAHRPHACRSSDDFQEKDQAVPMSSSHQCRHLHRGIQERTWHPRPRERPSWNHETRESDTMTIEFIWNERMMLVHWSIWESCKALYSSIFFCILYFFHVKHCIFQNTKFFFWYFVFFDFFSLSRSLLRSLVKQICPTVRNKGIH